MLKRAFFRIRESIRKYFKLRKQLLLCQRVCRDMNHTVASGPFKGLRYIHDSVGSRLCPKILGCYEQELHPWITKLLREPYDFIVNIGCAEGYYAVGFAREARSGATIHAYDISDKARSLITNLAAMNGLTSRLTIGGAFTHQDFARYAGKRTLILCDIEGAEEELLDPDRAPWLREFDILVEVHDGMEAGKIETALRRRFGPSHSIELATAGESRGQVAHLHPVLASAGGLAVATDEDRTFGMRWLFMKTLKGRESSVVSL